MKNQRMINTQITNNDDFLELPITSQYIYYRLIENCDNEGFIDNVKMLCRSFQCSMKDIENLVEANFLITKDKKIYCIKHWNILQWQRYERLAPSKYSLRDDLYIKENGSYTLNENEGIRYIAFFEIIKRYAKNEPRDKKEYYYNYVVKLINKYNINQLTINNKQITINNNQISIINKHLQANDSQCLSNDNDYENPFSD